MTTNSEVIPYLSVVVGARNDNHGGNLRKRLQIFVTSVLSQAKRHSVPTELIIVEWNPPQETSSLSEVLDMSAGSALCPTRIIKVSPSLHQRFGHASVMPLYQMMAKNVGIKRAKGKFILATNLDLVFSNELFQFFSKASLKEKEIYRIDRHDIDQEIPEKASIDAQLEYCQSHIIRLNGKRGTASFESDFFLEHYPLALFEKGVIDGMPLLHLNACGDFQLMSRNDWFNIRGYPEFDMYAMHLDSILASQAHSFGIQEVYLPDPLRIYHIEHPGSGWSPEQKTDPKFTPVFQNNTLKKLSDEELNMLRIDIHGSSTPTTFNSHNWGLGELDLPEQVIC